LTASNAAHLLSFARGQRRALGLWHCVWVCARAPMCVTACGCVCVGVFWLQVLVGSIGALTFCVCVRVRVCAAAPTFFWKKGNICTCAQCTPAACAHVLCRHIFVNFSLLCVYIDWMCMSMCMCVCARCMFAHICVYECRHASRHVDLLRGRNCPSNKMMACKVRGCWLLSYVDNPRENINSQTEEQHLQLTTFVVTCTWGGGGPAACCSQLSFSFWVFSLATSMFAAL
jgi:hypothetical protein